MSEFEMAVPPEKFHILVVEDQRADVDLICESFESNERLAVHVAPDGDEGYDFIFRRGRHADAPRPDLVLLDLNLPRLDGRELLAEIKADEQLRSIPVVIFTTSHRREDIELSYSNNANCYITKPDTVKQFFDVMRRIERFWLGTATLPVAGDATDA